MASARGLLFWGAAYCCLTTSILAEQRATARTDESRTWSRNPAAAVLVAYPPRNGGGGGGGSRGKFSDDDDGGDYSDDQGGNSNQNFVQQPAAPPAPPPKPKPVAKGPFLVRPYTPNRLGPAPAVASMAARDKLLKELESAVSTQLDTLDDVLKAAGISISATRVLVNEARQNSGSGLDADLVRDLQRAVNDKDGAKVEEAASALRLVDTHVDVAVLATYAAQLRNCVEEAVDPSDFRAVVEAQKCGKKFQKKLLKSKRLDKQLREGVNDKIDAVLAMLNARRELKQANGPASDGGAKSLEWMTGSAWVISTPALKPGAVSYVTSDLLIAGTRVVGPVTVTKSTVAAAFGCLGLDSGIPVQETASTLGPARNVAFINAPDSGRDFAFQLNGYDFTLKPGTMYQFTNSDDKDRKIETFRYAGSDGQIKAGFNLIDDGKTIKEAYFVARPNGASWTIEREKLPMFFGTQLPAVSLPVSYIFNDTDSPVNFSFDGGKYTLLARTGRRFDRVSNWRIAFATSKAPDKVHTKAGERAFTLSGGRSWKFIDDGDGLDLKSREPARLVIDNSANRVPFTFMLGDRQERIEPLGKWQRDYPVPPASFPVAYDQGNSAMARVSLEVAKVYTVGVSQTLQFVLSSDRDGERPTLDVQRELALAREKQLVELAEKLADGQQPAPESTKTGELAARPAAAPAPSPKRGDDESGSRLPAAHILAVGISKYANSKIDLKYADQDATDFVEAFKNSGRGVYREVSSQLLVNDKATRAAIEKGLGQLRKSGQKGDTVVLFFAGHGLSEDEKRFYLATHELDPEDLISTAVKYNDIADTVDTLTSRKCRILIFVDACNSGTLALALGENKRALVDRSMKEVHSAYGNATAGSILLASSATGEYSSERDEWKHGAFTKAILDGIADPDCDADGDGKISVAEIEGALSKRLASLTGNKQKLQSVWSFDKVSSFPLLDAAR